MDAHPQPGYLVAVQLTKKFLACKPMRDSLRPASPQRCHGASYAGRCPCLTKRLEHHPRELGGGGLHRLYRAPCANSLGLVELCHDNLCPGIGQHEFKPVIGIIRIHGYVAAACSQDAQRTNYQLD
jgi:hypothetical protein